MTDISIDYLGIKLKNPVIAGACDLWTRDKKIVQVEESGAAALVYKSLFEEQIQLERLELDEMTEQYDERHAMMTDIFPDVKHSGPQQHILRLKKVKSLLGIPVIASLNAINETTWQDYAKRIEDTGVDALELNFYSVGRYGSKDKEKIVTDQVTAIQKVKESVSIPVSIKLSFFYDDPVDIIKLMSEAGADGFVIFNRFFQPDIDIEKEKHIQRLELSKEGDYKLPLRFAGLLFEEIDADICGSTGIYGPQDLVKLLLAGADCIQTVSAIYKKGTKAISEMIDGLNDWMTEKGYEKIPDFKGKLSNKKLKNTSIYKRAQYIEMLMKSERILKDRPI